MLFDKSFFIFNQVIIKIFMPKGLKKSAFYCKIIISAKIKEAIEYNGYFANDIWKIR